MLVDECATTNTTPHWHTDERLTTLDTNLMEKSNNANLSQQSMTAQGLINPELTKVTSEAMEQVLQIKLLSPDAKLPLQGSDDAIGYDLCAVQETELKPGQRKAIPTEIAIALPSGTYGRIAPRSGLSVKSSIDVGAGVIDPDYQGEIKVLLINNGNSDFQIKKHD